MARIRGDRSRGTRLLLVIATTMLLAGCATATTGLSTASPTASASASATASPSPTPTAACPQVEGVELPPDCAPYDPDNAMAQNDRYRDRVDLSEASRAAAERPATDIRTALEALRASGDLSVDAVEDAISDAGLSDIQIIGDERAVAFGVAAPEGGCIFGEVSADVLSVEVGGIIMDGGCLPAVGH